MIKIPNNRKTDEERIFYSAVRIHGNKSVISIEEKDVYDDLSKHSFSFMQSSGGGGGGGK